MSTPNPGRFDQLTDEQRSAVARKGRNASPWGRGPMCETKVAQASYARYRKKGKSDGRPA